MTIVAYLASDLAAPSHTFIRREIEALRSRGVSIRSFSVRRGEHADECIQGRSPLDYAAALIRSLALRPRRFLSGLRLALRHRPAGAKAFLWSLFHFVEAALLAERLRVAGAVRLHTHFANSGATVGMIAAALAELPWSLTLHGISETDHPAGQLLGAKLARADHVACASYFIRAQAMRLSDPADWSKMHIVRCGVDTARLRPPPPQPLASRPRLLSVGRLSPEKGHAGLIAACAKLAAAGEEFDLVIVGGGPCDAELRRRVGEAGLAELVHFTGPLDEVATLDQMARSDLLVLPSLMEGLPVVLIEALALERPVLASRVAGIPELVDHGEAGFLFTPSNWDELADTLQRMLAERDKWEAWGRAGRRRVEAEFDIGAAAERLVLLFEGATAGAVRASHHQ